MKNGKVLLRLCVAAGLVLFSVFGSPVVAQEPDDEVIEEITVYGQALSMERALDVKRNSNEIVDAIAQDDIGRLPDLNTAQAVLRVPGVAVQNDQGEARFPVIRGLNATYNRTTVDGAIIASPERGSIARAVPLDLIPAFLLSRIEVRKSITPELDHNAIGGTINLVTRSAFESDGPFLFGGLFAGRHEQSGDGTTLNDGEDVFPWRGNFAAGTTFGADDQFGAVLGIDYSIRNFEIPQVEVDDADYTEFDAAGNNVGLGNGNGFVVPTNQRIFFYNNVRERIGVTGRLEWQPSDNVYADLAVYYNEYNDDERRDEERYELGTSGSSAEPAAIREQTPTTGITDTGFNIVGIGRFTLDRDITLVRTGLDWDLAPGLLLEAGAAFTQAELFNPEVTDAFQTGTDLGALYDTSQFYNTVTPLDPSEFNDLTNYGHVNRGILDRFTDEDTIELTVDLGWDETPVEGLSFQTGALLRDLDKSEGFNFRRLVAGDGVGYTLADVADQGLADVTWQGGYRLDNRIDLEASDAFVASNAFDEVLNLDRGSDATETVTAAYAMGTWEAGPWTVVGGLRYEQTDWDGRPLDGETVEGDYSNVLPSVNVRYRLADDLVLRAAASRTLGRPNISDLTRGVSINLTDNTISRSNPELEPRVSTNFDLSLEWYIPNGILAAGVFWKDIEDEIFFLTTDGPVTVDGVTYDAVSQPENAASAEILGFEAQYQQTLSFLPAPFDGFGILANATVLDTTFEVPLGDGSTRETNFFQQPDLTGNLTVFYATRNLEIRASYNYTDEFLDSLNAGDPNRDEYWDARSQVDMQARFNVTDRITVIGEVQNLTDEGRRELTGPGAQYLQEDAVFGRTWWLGLTWTAD